MKRNTGTVVQRRTTTFPATLLSARHGWVRQLPTAARPLREETGLRRASCRGGRADPAQLGSQRQRPALNRPLTPWWWEWLILAEESLRCWGPTLLPANLSTVFGTVDFQSQSPGWAIPTPVPCDPSQEELCRLCSTEELTEQHLHQPQPFTLRKKNK